MITLDGLELPEELRWEDEFAWMGQAAVVRRTLSGRLVVDAADVPEGSGRPVTLTGDDAWMTRADLETLRGWTDAPGRVMTLGLHDERTYQVMFRAWEPPVIEAEPVSRTAFPGDGTWYRVTVRLSVV